jgi:hypothetical protein
MSFEWLATIEMKRHTCTQVVVGPITAVLAVAFVN